MAYVFSMDKVDLILKDGIKTDEDIKELVSAIEFLTRANRKINEEKEFICSGYDLSIETNKIKINQLRECIKNKLIEDKKDKIKIDKIASISLKEGSSKWEISNDEDLIKEISNRLTREEFESVVKIEYKLDKRLLNKIFAEWEREGKVPSCIIKNESQNSVKISTEDGFFSEPKQDIKKVIGGDIEI